MKKIIFLILFYIFTFQISHSAVYEASTLHNAVSRSETVQDLFNKRWSQIIEKNLLIDAYGRINWLNDFNVNTYNSGSGEKEAIDMTLVRTYGSLTLNYPIMGDGYLKTLERRYDKPTPIFADKDRVENESEYESGDENSFLKSYWNKNSLLLGFTATGFHYGLTRETTIDRGSAGDETVTDYKYTQFFDDIFALSLIYNPYIFIHGGIIINNEIEPDEESMVDYGDSSGTSIRYFISSNIFSFLDVNASSNKDELESMSIHLGITEGVSKITPLPEYIPGFTIGYEVLKLYQDKGYDPVWVDTPYQTNGSKKTSDMNSSERANANIHFVNLQLEENLGNLIFIDLFVQYQYCEEDLYDKRNNEKISLSEFKEKRATVGVNLFGFSRDSKYQYLKVYFGMSSYWDPAIALHRDKGSCYSIEGWIFGMDYAFPFGGAEMSVKKNYSEELRSLAEAADKYVLEGSIYFRI